MPNTCFLQINNPSPTIGSDDQTIIVVDGRAGGGKSATLNFLQEYYGYLAVPKLSDRAPRVLSYFSPGESVCVSPAEFTRRASLPGYHWYEYGERRYGVSNTDIAERLAQSGVVALVSNSDLFNRAIQADFAGTARFVRVYINTPSDKILARLRAEGTPEDEISARMNRPRPLGESFETHPELYDHVLDNRGDWVSFEDQLHQLATQYVAGPLRAAASAA